MWFHLKIEWGIRFPRDEIFRLMRIVDPEGIRVRKRRRLHRRRYICKGPNAVWHGDGYDKIKPFGFCIHGCVDGFSRRIIWLRVGETNNNPKVIARYYLEAVQQLEVVPAKIRCDLGTENSILTNLQPLFHHDENGQTACLKSFIYGKSTSYQRGGPSFDDNVYIGGLIYLKKCENRIFLMTQKFFTVNVSSSVLCTLFNQLDMVTRNWNLHQISRSRKTEVPTGKPDAMYFLPQLYDASDQGTFVDIRDVSACMTIFEYDNKSIALNKFVQLIELLKPGVGIPVTAREGLNLYMEITELLEHYQ
ncbi:hypothetical protein SNE40_018136 [Patella caerulea]|uniref:Integrase core domain-containing protein n=1 Tax=Patella caerulea TaxID=87958 RepID=A0AAN8J953_PATCE